jgi:hypothetical protein
MQEEKGAQPSTLILISILGARQQVVAGVDYELTLKVRLNGREREADAVVWSQARRVPDPHELTSWNWR